MSVPDYPLGQTLDFKFTSRAFATGVPTTLSGSPVVEVYEDNDLTQIVVGETLTVDFDAVVGLNNLRIVATSGNGYEVGKSYHAILSVGTVGGTSVVGEVVAQFSIERSAALMPTVAGRTLDVAATGEAGVDFDNILGTLDAAEIGANAITSAKIATDAIGAAQIAANAIGASELATDAIGDAQIATGAIASTAFAAGAIDAAAIANGAIDAATFAAGAIDAAAIANGAIDAATFAAGAIDAAAIATGAIDADAIATDAITAAKIAANAIGASELATDAIGSAQLATTAVDEIADGVWNEDATAHQTLGTFGQAIGDPVANAETIYEAVVTDAAGTNVAADIIGIQSDTDDIQTRLPAALVGGAMDSDVSAIQANAITAAAIATDAITAAKIAANAIGASELATDAIGDAQIATGAIASTAFAAGAIDAAAIATDAIGSAELATDAIGAAQIAANAIGASELATDAIGSDQLAATAVNEIADGVWDEAMSGHVTVGTSGQVINALGAIRAGEVADAGALAGDFDVDGFTEATNDHFNGMVMVFTNGVLIGQARVITDYTGAGQNCVFAEPWTEAPADNDDFVIVPPGMVMGGTLQQVLRLLITVLDQTTGQIDAGTFAAGAIDAAALATDAVQEIADAVLPATNTALSNIEFLMVDDTDHITPKTGLTVTGTRSIDGAAFAAVSGTIAEVGNGIYQFDALAADMNGGIITFRFISATADDTFITIRTAL